MGRRRKGSVEKGLRKLESVKLDFTAASAEASRRVRSCDGCDARCCKVGLNSMRVSRVEALAIRLRLEEADLESLVPEILDRAEAETRERALETDDTATYTCPLLSPDDRCLVHGPAQPAGCLTFQPVDDGGCDHDLAFFNHHSPRLKAADRAAFGRESPPLPIPVALLKVFRRGRRGPGRREGRG